MSTLSQRLFGYYSYSPSPDRDQNSWLRGSLGSPDPMNHDIRADIYQLLVTGVHHSKNRDVFLAVFCDMLTTYMTKGVIGSLQLQFRD